MHRKRSFDRVRRRTIEMSSTAALSIDMIYDLSVATLDLPDRTTSILTSPPRTRVRTSTTPYHGSHILVSTPHVPFSVCCVPPSLSDPYIFLFPLHHSPVPFFLFTFSFFFFSFFLPSSDLLPENSVRYLRTASHIALEVLCVFVYICYARSRM